MVITEIVRYQVNFDADNFSILCPLGTNKFSGLATSNLPKLYVASIDNSPIYVGITKQSIRSRLRLGWKATGKGGYYGYAWRHKFTEVNLDLWCHTDATTEKSNCLDIETVEAELVYLIRKAGQWPLYQTEIHFHPSNDEHRAAAATIAARYGIPT